MDDVSVIGIDLAKRVFEVHGAARDGTVCFRKRMMPGLKSARRRSGRNRTLLGLESCSLTGSNIIWFAADGFVMGIPVVAFATLRLT